MNLKQLRKRIAALPDIGNGSPYSWLGHRNDLRNRILNPTEGEMRSAPAWFLFWPTVHATMYVGQAPYIKKELDAVLECYSSEVLRPGKFFGEPAIYNDMSTNMIHQAYHLLQYESRLGIRVKDLSTVVEFGGGYGAMCLLINRLGFTGDYYIVDLPEFALLQEYYLSHQKVKAIWEYPFKPNEFDLLIGLFSLSEVDNETERWLFLQNHPAMSYLFAYNHQWHSTNNHEWFKLIQKELDYDWVNYPIEHLPGRFYLLGVE